MEKREKLWLKITIYAIGYGVYGPGIVIPLITAILSEFTDASLFATNMVLSGGASIFGLISALLTGVFVKYIDKRKLLLFGTTLFFLSGVSGIFATSMNYLIVIQSLCGFADGIMLVTVLTLIPELFSDEKERSSIFAMNFAFSSLFSMITIFMAGVLCTISWRLAFITDIVAVIPIFLVYKNIPATAKEEQVAKSDKPKEKINWNPLPVIIAISIYLIINSLAVIPYFMLDLYVSENLLGNSVLTGTLSTVVNLVALGFSVIFSKVYMKTKRIMPFVFSVILSLVFIFLFLTRSVPVVFICLALQGVMSTTVYLYYQCVIAQKTPSSKLGFYMGLYMVAQYLGPVIGPYLPNVVSGVVPSVDTLTKSYVYLGIVAGVIAVFYGIGALVKPKENIVQ